ncbi:dTMP kinase [Labedaea rhizosphaerae]|uniref:dTMP kinase n=1 Tax=Labedaea rhizosphaerae TaxID=598644 RepID=A0A4V3D093_LABRH|nr:dTMP kinase [Labedaea rhizosphaerae]TDQ04865.1 dTMP kinase [Labedaea rhizosphaerae]
MSGHGIFVTIDGLAGAGKSVTTGGLRSKLVRLGYRVHTTAEPTQGRLGKIARRSTEIYSGHALACLVAADRYHHVLQRMDGVPVEFIEALNSAAPPPDLAIFLLADPNVAARRIARRGSHDRFQAGLATSTAEAEFYRDAADRLADRWGKRPLLLDTTTTRTDELVAVIAMHVAALAGPPRHQSETA